MAQKNVLLIAKRHAELLIRYHKLFKTALSLVYYHYEEHNMWRNRA
jgi:hypothetical protein